MLKLFFALVVAKISAFFVRLFKFGLGSSLPGLLAEKIDSKIAQKLTTKIKEGVILITGTNGKTTTARLIASIIETAGFTKIHNQTGANLVRGVISAMAINLPMINKKRIDFGIFEIDEATLPEAVEKLNPKIIIFNNLFRDQLDRYGEIDKILKIWERTLKKISQKTKIIQNIDDPNLAFLVINLKSQTYTFGIEDEKYKISKVPSFADTIFCPKCMTKLEYQTLYFSHLGKYFCPKCKFSRPQPQIFASEINFQNQHGIQIKISVTQKNHFTSNKTKTVESKTIEIKTNLFGLYNVYNILAAVACGKLLGFSDKIIKTGIEKFTPAFGRFEKAKINNTPVIIFLIKNPTGATEVIRALTYNKEEKNFLVILNDNIPDGRDISWIWDTDWESLANFVNFIFVSGRRAEDMALRLKYAEIPQEKIFLIKDPKTALFSACEKSKNQPLYILPNYSAMYSLRNFLAKKGYLPKIM